MLVRVSACPGRPLPPSALRVPLSPAALRYDDTIVLMHLYRW
jgi:hypothetical protein